MISISKFVGLIAAVGFSRAVFVCAIGLLAVHIVTFEQFVILVLFGFATDGISTKGVLPKNSSSRRIGKVR